MLIEAGEEYYVLYGGKDFKYKLLHIQAIFDEVYADCKVWSNYKNTWVYERISMDYFELMKKENRLISRGKRPTLSFKKEKNYV